MKNVIKYALKGVLFLIGMCAFCVLFGEPSEKIDMVDVIVLKTLSVGVLVGVALCWFRGMGKKEYDDMMNEEI